MDIEVPVNGVAFSISMLLVGRIVNWDSCIKR